MNVRFAPDVTTPARLAVEQRAGLIDAEPREQRTWSYRMSDRSAANIRSLIEDPRVEDTAHIDRRNLRVELEWAGPEWLRVPAENEWLARIAWGLGAVAVLFAAAWVRSLAGVGAWLAELRRSIWFTRITRAIVATSGRGMSVVRRLSRSPSNTRLRDGDVRPGPAEVAIGIAIGLVFLWPLLLNGPYEEEIVQATVFPNQVFYRELFRGNWLFWLNDLGFGTPFPLGDPFMFHPVFGPLAGVGVPLRISLSALWIAHVVLMVVYFQRLMALTGIRLRLRLILLVCYLYSATSTLYFYDSDWVQMVISWSLYPVLVYYLHDAVRGGAERRFWYTAIRLALLFAFWILNAHPGYLVPLTLVLAVYVVCAARPARATYAVLAAGAALCTLAVLPRVYFIVSEMRLFEPQARILREGASLAHYLRALTFDPGNRAPFLGIGLMVAATASVLAIRRLPDAHLRACAISFVAAIGLNVMPPQVLPGVGAWLFRDAMIFFGLLAGGYMLQRWWSSSRPAATVATLALIAIQFAHQYTTIVKPSLRDVSTRGNRLLFYRYQDQAVGLGAALVAQSQVYGRRLFLSPLVDQAMRGRLSGDGIHFSSDLVLLGLNPVNGWFKNVSMETLEPTSLIMESAITGDWQVMDNATLLDVLGIDLVVSAAPEGELPPGLDVVERYPSTRLDMDLLISANADAWPHAVLLAADAASVTLPVRPGCRHDRALCRDYEALRSRRLPDAVTLEESDGRYVARLNAAEQERLLFLSVTYRPPWEAMSVSGTLDVVPIADAFVGVVVPPGVDEVTLYYAPRTFMRLTWFGTAWFLLLLVTWCAMWVRTRRAPLPDGTAELAVNGGRVA